MPGWVCSLSLLDHSDRPGIGDRTNEGDLDSVVMVLVTYGRIACDGGRRFVEITPNSQLATQYSKRAKERERERETR